MYVYFWRFTARYNETGGTDTGKEDETMWHERTNTMVIAVWKRRKILCVVSTHAEFTRTNHTVLKCVVLKKRFLELRKIWYREAFVAETDNNDFGI